MLQPVINALHQIKDLPAVTISTAHGLSVERDTHDQVVKTKLEIIVPDQQVEPPCRPFRKPRTPAIPATDASSFSRSR
jgi:hypothetical protein